jgi:hypothetical protein
MGLYTQIVNLSVPPESTPGTVVTVLVDVKCISSPYQTLVIKVEGVAEYQTGGQENMTFICAQSNTWWTNTAPGLTSTFYSSFRMPSSNVILRIRSYWYASLSIPTDGTWYLEDEVTQSVALYTPKVTISKMQLEYNSSRVSIPVFNIPQNTSGLVHAWVRNNASTTTQVGILISVQDPDNVEVSSYYTSSYLYISPGSEYEFIGNRFTLNKPGRWMVCVAVYTGDPTNPKMGDVYYDTLCTVVSTQPPPPTTPTITGFKIQNYINV